MPPYRVIGHGISRRLHDESRRIALFFERRIVALLAIWASIAILGGLMRVAVLFHNYPHLATDDRIPGLMLPYLMIAAAPGLAYWLASRAYPQGLGRNQPSLRLAAFGSWQALPEGKAQSYPGYGFEGFLVSLAGGMLLTMIMRLGTYLLAMPAMPVGAPAWATAAFRIMSFDVAFLSFMYTVCFTMALRAAPLFPRMLVLTWCYDLLMQLAIAKYIAAAGVVPGIVAGPFAELLGGNVRKVLISMAIWLPYLVLSTRVNLTYRNRVRAPALSGS